MNEKSRGKRVRIITDEVKYRRHQRRKLIRLFVRAAVWAIFLVIGTVIFLLILDKMQPHAQE